jgi:hypothetical protein
MTDSDKAFLGVAELYRQFSSMPYTPRKYSSQGKFMLDPALNLRGPRFSLDPLYNGQVDYVFVPDPVYGEE